MSTRFDLKPNVRVLEVGCGAGWLWEQSTIPVPSGVDLVLTDLSPGMVEEAVARVRATGRFDSVTGKTADAQSLPFEPHAFDRVIANHMLYHLPDPSRGVGELARVTAPSGQVVVATNGRGHMRELWEIRSEVFGIERVDHTIDVFGVDLQRHRLLCLHRTQEQLADSCSSAGSAAEDHHQGHSSASV